MANRDHGEGWTTRAHENRKARAAGLMRGEPTTTERILAQLNRRFVSSVPHQERRWDDSPEKMASNLREQYKVQEEARARRGLRRP